MTNTQVRNRLVTLSHRILKAQLEFDQLKNEIRKDNEPGRYDGGITVYRVNETVVKRHVRKGYTAVRVV